MVAATIALLRESGYGSLSIDAVAVRAGTTRPTLYRRWRDKAHLVTDVLSKTIEPLLDPDTGDARRDLLDIAHQLRAALAAPEFGLVLLGVYADSAARPELATALRELYLPRRAGVWDSVLRRGVQRQQLRAEIDPEDARDLLIGPLLYHWITRGALAERDVDRLVDAVWPALARPV